MRFGDVFEIINEGILDPGTSRFNHMYPGGEFKILKNIRGVYHIKYTKYGKFTGYLDYINKKVLERGLKNGIFKRKEK